MLNLRRISRSHDDGHPLSNALPTLHNVLGQLGSTCSISQPCAPFERQNVGFSATFIGFIRGDLYWAFYLDLCVQGVCQDEVWGRDFCFS
ncbi:MAG: hypothetical protein JWQ49_3171 [Edaphobacter sp.]|nr:hypothetical protein [Edaphobacter sp.]